MGFWDSLGLEFIDDEDEDSGVLESLEGQSETVQSQSKPKTTGNPSKLSSYTKEDLIVFMMVLVLGAAAGFGYSKLLGKKDLPGHPITPNEIHHHYPGGVQTEEKPKHSHAVEQHPPQPKKASMRHGYYLDENLDAVLDPPRVMENWIIERSFSGEIVDVKKIPDADTML